MITKEELMIGNILNYDTEEEILPTVIDWQDLKWLSERREDFNKYHSGIQLTPEILTAWCGFELCKPCVNFPAGFNKMPYYAKKGILLFFNEGNDINFLFAKADQIIGVYVVVDSGWHSKLHELQNFYFWNSGKQQLKIKLPK